MMKHQVRAKLVEQGSSYRKWAQEHGYNPRTVTQAVDRWSVRDDQPRGRMTYDILQRLSESTGIEIVKGALS